MNVDHVSTLLRRLFQTQEGLREIDGEMRVPWTVAQWMIFGLVLISLIIAMIYIYQRIQRYLASRPRTFPALLRELDRIDQLRLRRRMNHDEVMVSLADVLRGGLRLADRRQGGTGGYRTTSEWLAWSQRYLTAQSQRQAVRIVLSRADSLKFSNAQSSLSEVREATIDTKALIETLANPIHSSVEPVRSREDAA